MAKEQMEGNQTTPASERRDALLNGDDGDVTLFTQSERLEQIWTHQDYQLQLCKIRDFEKIIEMTRIQIDDIYLQSNSICDHFVSLGLKKILQRHLRSFLSNLQLKVDRLTPQLKEAATIIDTLEMDIGQYRKSLDSKTLVLTKMMHHVSTQHYLKIMIARVTELEAYFMDNHQHKQDEAVSSNFFVDKTAKDLQYLRVRLRSIQSALTAAHHAKEVAAIQAILDSLLFRVERLRSELAIASTRIVHLHELMTSWEAQLDQSPRI